MSRALDESVKESLRHGNHRAVFDEISTALTEASNELLEIELLGKSHVLGAEVLLRDGNAIAIPKLRLVQAFLVAHKIFLSYLGDAGTISTDEILKSTAVMLLMDPEHLTAANTRKRVIGHQPQGENGNAREILRLEKHIMDSLLTSRLHRHTKSPTMWNHRRWLMDQFRLHELDVPAEHDISNIIMVSGERHPRNYYAWCHARYLINTFITSDQALQHLISATQKWCFAHHDDISGWQFLLFLLDKRTTPETSSPVFRETLKLAASFKWRNESVWYFLRHVAAWGSTNADLDEFELVRRTLWESAPPDGSEQLTLERAEKWLSASQGLTVIDAGLEEMP